MAEIVDLPASTGVADTDLFVVYQPGESVDKSRKATRTQVLNGILRSGAAASVTTLAASTSVTAPAGAIDALTVATSVTVGAVLSKILTNTASVAIPTLAAAASGDVTMTVTGAVAGDVVILNAQAALPAGLLFRAYVSGANTVTISVTNASNASITGASYSLKAVLFRVT